jgi:hypothetical protein
MKEGNKKCTQNCCYSCDNCELDAQLVMNVYMLYVIPHLATFKINFLSIIFIQN